MKKSELGNGLRARQIKLGQVEKHIIDSLSDDDIIDAYITCSCCGEKSLTEIELIQCINDSVDTNDWVDRACNFHNKN